MFVIDRAGRITRWNEGVRHDAHLVKSLAPGELGQGAVELLRRGLGDTTEA